MNRLKKWLLLNNVNYKKWIIVIYVLCIMLPIFIAISIDEYGESTIAKTLSCAVLLVFFVVFFIYDYRKKVADDWGLIGVSTKSDWLDEAKKEAPKAHTVKIMASNELDKVAELVGALPENCEIKLLLLDPASDYLRFTDNGDGYADCLARLSSVKNAEIKLFDLVPMDVTVIINDDVFVSPMTQKLSDGRRIVRHFSGKKRGTEQYNGIFMHVWEHPQNEYTEERANEE